MQVRTLSTAQRVLREVISRLRRLSPGELDLLLLGDCAEQRALLWVAVSRRYAFIGEFAVEVLRERYLNLRSDVRHDDFDAFYIRKSDWHPKLERISTRKKLRQILFKIMKDANLLVDDHRINPLLLSARLLHTLSLETWPLMDFKRDA